MSILNNKMQLNGKSPGVFYFFVQGSNIIYFQYHFYSATTPKQLKCFKKINSFDKYYVHSYTRSHATLLKLFQIWEFVVKLTIQTLIAEQTDIASHTWTIMEIP